MLRVSSTLAYDRSFTTRRASPHALWLLVALGAACQGGDSPGPPPSAPGVVGGRPPGIFLPEPELGAPSAWREAPGPTTPPQEPAGLPAADDVYLFGTCEPALAVNPLDPRNLAHASLFVLRVSTDGGRTWEPGVSPQVDPGQGWAGDSSLAFDSQGRLFWSYLGRAFDPGGNEIGMELYVAECDPATGALLPGSPVNVTDSHGVGLPAGGLHENDKQWLLADASPVSPFRDRLYLVWTEFAGVDTIVHFARSENHGRTWTRIPQLSRRSDGLVWPTHGTVAPNGDVYVTYHERGDASGTSGQVYLHRSVDGGESFGSRTRPFRRGRADVTFNVQTAAGAIPGATFWLQGSAQAWVLADPFVDGRIYVVACDDPDDDHSSGDASNVYLVVSDDHGATWSPPRRVDSGPGTSFQVMPTAAIDPDTGLIAVHYYDNRGGGTNAAGNWLLDVYATLSLDGGRTFCRDFRINDMPFDPDPGAPVRYPGPPATTRIGEYNGIAAADGRVGAVWCANLVNAQVPFVFQQVVFDAFGLPVDVDLLPGSAVNTVQVSSHGVLPLALLGSSGFDPLSVDPLSASFGPGGAAEVHHRGHPADVDEDGFQDLLLHFGTSESGLALGDVEARLEARTYGGVLVEGSDSLRTAVGFAYVIEGFEGGVGAYRRIGSIGTFEASSAAAHDGDLGLRVGNAVGWAYRDDLAVHVARGDTLSTWVNLGARPNGRSYFGFGATAAGTLSLVAAPNSGELRLERNDGYLFTYLNSRPQAWDADTWYRLEVVWETDGSLTGNLYASDGTTLLNRVTAFDATVSEGGLAFRAFGSSAASFDTVQVVEGPASRPAAR